MPVINKNNIFRFIRYVVFAGNALAILLLFVSVLAWKISPEKSGMFAYIGLGFPFIVVANILFLFLWFIFFKWKYIIISLASLLICSQAILTYFPVHSKTKEIPEDCVKVLSYNVMGFNWFKEKNIEENPTIAYIRDSDADIVCLQEFLSLEDSKEQNSERIKKALKNYPYHSIVKLDTRFKSTSKKYTYGLACFSKYPITKTQKIPLDTRDNGTVLYEIQINDKVITVINNHLESNRVTTDDKKLYEKFFSDVNRHALDEVTHNIRLRLGIAYKKRAQQADLINDWIKKQETDGIIVCGDFNDTPISYAYKKIKGELKDSYAETGFGTGITYHENYFLFRIDYILHSKNMQAYNCTVDKVRHSDHYPLWTYLKIG